MRTKKNKMKKGFLMLREDEYLGKGMINGGVGGGV